MGARPADPSERLERAEERQRVWSSLDGLPLRQRQVLLLRAQGMSYAEIAAALEIPMASVGQTLARALEAFRRVHRETADAPD
jgi:RNA polymerase sigma factor (sigma-70 family)